MINIQKRIYTTAKTLRPFITKHWCFKTKNFVSLYQELGERDREIFYFDVKVVSCIIDIDIYYRPRMSL